MIVPVQLVISAEYITSQRNHYREGLLWNPGIKAYYVKIPEKSTTSTDHDSNRNHSP